MKTRIESLLNFVLILACFLYLAFQFSVGYARADFDYFLSLTQLNPNVSYGANIGGPTFNSGAVTSFSPLAPFQVCSISVDAARFTSSGATGRLDGLQINVYSGTSTFSFGNSFYSGKTLIARPTSYYQVVDSTHQEYVYNFSPCFSASAGQWYNIIATATNGTYSTSTYYKVVGNNNVPGGMIEEGSAKWYGFALNGNNYHGQGAIHQISVRINGRVVFTPGAPYPGMPATFTATSGVSSFDFSSSQVYCDNNFPPSGFLNLANNLCLVIGFLFIPSATSIDTLYSIPDELATRVPFAYFNDIENTFNNLQPVASGTSYFGNVILDYPSLGVATNSMFALQKVTLLSTTTVRYYFSDSTWQTYMNLITLAVWMMLVYYMFFKVRDLIKK